MIVRTGAWVLVEGWKQAHLMNARAREMRCGQALPKGRGHDRPQPVTPRCRRCQALEDHEKAAAAPAVY